MAVRAFTAPQSGALVLDLDAPAAEVTIVVGRYAETATAELSGPAEIVDDARSDMAGDRWSLTLPSPRPTVIGDGTIINQHGGTVIVGDTMSISGLSIGGGRVQIGSIRGATVVSAGGVAAAEPVRLAVILPAGSRLDARMEFGKLTTRGQMLDADVISTSADVHVEVAENLRVRTSSGDITTHAVAVSADLTTMSGDIEVRDTTGRVRASTMSGDIAISADYPASIDADSMSGDITVRAARGVTHNVRAHSMSGDVRTTTR